MLVGFSGSGKSSVCDELVRLGGWRGIDLDREIETQTGRTITEIIRVEGEEKFRTLESELLSALLAEKSASSEQKVIATGGGLVTKERNRKLLAEQAYVVTLAVAPKFAAERIRKDEEAVRSKGIASLRPIVAGGADIGEIEIRVEQLMESRKDVYEGKDLKSAFTLWTDRISASDAARIVQREFHLGEFQLAKQKVKKEKFTVFPLRCGDSGSDFQTEVVIGCGILDSLGLRIAAEFPKLERIVVLVDANVARSWDEKLRAALEHVRKPALFVEIPSGEKAKNLSLAQELLSKMLEFGVSRHDVLVAAGGGVVGDLGGLVASVFMRGIGLVQVPTTVIAQVDSAIGGKTAVNLEGGKNVVGTFYPGRVVLTDIDFLSTLPEREFRSGLAEVVKYGLIASERFFCWLEENKVEVLKRSKSALTEIVRESSRTKVDFVASDLRDLLGQRMLLNFGHTVGHAVEQLTGYTELLHGEAVSIGMGVALRMGYRLGITPKNLISRSELLLKDFGLPLEIPSSLMEGAADGKSDFSERWAKAIRADKKREGEEVRFVVVEGLGKARGVNVKLADVVKCIAEAV